MSPHCSLLLCGVTHLLLLLSGSPASSSSAANSRCPKDTTLYLSVMAPFPDSSPGLGPGWKGGPAVIPGAQLAVQHINGRCDVLPDYRLEVLVGDSGCNIMSKATINTTWTLFEAPESKSVIGIIGPGCSEAADIVGRLLAHPNVSLLHIAPSATSPELVNTTIYPNTFRPIASSLGFIEMYRALIIENNYTKVAILFEAERTNHIKSAERLEKMLDEMGLQSASFAMFGRFLIPLDQIRNEYRVVFVFAGGSISRKLMCLAQNRSMLYPNYQFIFSERRLDHFTGTNVSFSLAGERYRCSQEEMELAVNGTVLSLIRLTREDRDTTLVSEMTYRQFYKEYMEQLDSYRSALNLSSSDVVETEHQSGYYDSTWALALSLNASIPHLDSSLSDYSYGNPDITEVIRKELLQVTFEGVRGRVKFSASTLDGTHVTVLDMFQVRPAGSVLLGNISVATYNPSVEGLKVFEPNAFISDLFNSEVVAPPLFVEVIVFIIVVLAILNIVFFQILHVTCTDAQSLKATSPALNHMIFSGCYLYLLSVLFLSLQLLPEAQQSVVFGVRCSGFIWCESVALTLIFATISVKTWRIFRIFSHSSGGLISHLEDYRLVVYICGFLLLDIGFNMVWNLVNPWYRDVVNKEDLKIRAVCNCDNVIVWLSCLVAQKGLLAIAVLYLSIATRRIPRQEYKQTKSTNILVYSLILLYFLTCPIYVILLSEISVSLVTVSYLALCVKNIACVVLCTIFLFLPPILPIFKAKWETAKLR